MNTNPTTQKEMSARLASALRKPGALTPLILLMGFIGALLRYVLETALPPHDGFPFATLIVNIFGCFALEIINQYVGRRLRLPPPLVKSLGVGLIGAFTTIAAFSTECLSFFHEGAFALAFIYIFATVVTTFVSALAGRIAAQFLALRRFRRLRQRHALQHLRRQSHLSEEDVSLAVSTSLASLTNSSGQPLEQNPKRSGSSGQPLEQNPKAGDTK